MRKINKVINILILVLLIVFLYGCEVSSSEESHNQLLTYEVIGNGSIRCELESGKEYDSNTYAFLLSVPNDGEELISWTINGVEKGNNSSVLVKMDVDQKIVAIFSTNKKEDEQDTQEDIKYNDETNLNVIYANLPDTWDNATMTIERTSGNTSYKMNKNDNNTWYFNLEENNINKASINKITFSSGSLKTETFNFDKDYNYFNYTGINKDGYLSGGFDIKKDDNLMKLSILEMNDVHGYIVQSSEGQAGLSNASYLIEKVRNEDNLDNTILVANGDMFQGTALSNLTHGLSVLNCMNEMKFDFMGIGNHEFDWDLEYILDYFDGDKENGEANFPLVNSNIAKSGTNELITDENIVSSYMIEKNGVKIGIISMIDDLQSSILYSKVKDYDFLGTSLCKAQAIELKNKGADVIIANIHGGDSSSPTNFDMNKYVANLEYNGEWLIDCVINGHTHTNQAAVITRAGQDLPIVQGGSYSYYVGQIDLYIDLDTKNVTTSSVFTTSTYQAGKNYTKSVQDIIDNEYLKVKDAMEEVYCVSTYTVTNKSAFKTWSANVMYTATDSICGICNTGGLRSTGNIKNGTKIGIENLYLINPFDDELIVVEMTGKQLYKFLSSNRSVYYSLKDGYTLNSLQSDNNKYKVTVVDYVYYWDTFPRGTNDYFTGLYMRDCLIEDLRLRETFNPTTDTTPMIGKLTK